MKLLVISAAYPPHRSGEATNTFYLCQHLADNGIDVHVLTSRNCIDPGHPRIRLYPVMRQWSWMEMPRLISAMKHCAPDVVLLIYIGWIYNDEFMITFAPTIAKRALPGVRFVTRFENAVGADARHVSAFSRAVRKAMASLEHNRDIDYCYGTLLRDSDRIVVLAESHRRALTQCSSEVAVKAIVVPPPPNMRITVEPNDQARARTRKRLGLSSDTFLISYIGYIYHGKGLETLLRAFAKVSKGRTSVRLLLMGGTIAPESGNPTTYLDELRHLAGFLGLQDRILWTGEYSWESEQPSLFLQGSDVCVLPFQRGVHLNNSSFASAISHACPVITTEGQMLEAPLVHKENVYLCPPECPEAIATAIIDLMDHPELRERLVQGSRQLANECFSWDRALDRTVAALSGQDDGQR